MKQANTSTTPLTGPDHSVLTSLITDASDIASEQHFNSTPTAVESRQHCFPICSSQNSLDSKLGSELFAVPLAVRHLWNALEICLLELVTDHETLVCALHSANGQ